MPLMFLAFYAVLNIVLDLVFVLVFHWGVKGAAVPIGWILADLTGLIYMRRMRVHTGENI